MTLKPGHRLGPYEILTSIGAGGMGVVYRARDTVLHREVAIKMLPAELNRDPDRLTRFTREAQSLAALNHANIAHIHGLEGSGKADPYLVMEFVDGEDLSQVIARGPMPLSEVLPIAKQLAVALEAAHEQTIVHRDLKPANIKVRADGTVKVLDFGLAKAMAPGAQANSDPTDSPTLTGHATRMGVILGTAAYMAPEQAKGKAVDKRADIWSFGVVLYEMLTGRALFAAETVQETLAAVITREVDLDVLPAGTPMRMRRLIAGCLVKDPRQRLRDIGDARLILDEEEGTSPTVVAAPSRGLRLLFGVAAIGIAVAAAAAAWIIKPVPFYPAFRLSIALDDGVQVTTPPAISPDGQTIAYAAGQSPSTSRLYVRPLNGFSARAVDSSTAAELPFFSPDGRTVGFFASGKMWRAPVAGGAATALVATPRSYGGTWLKDGHIVYVPSINAGLWLIPAEGGKAEQLTTPDDASSGYGHVFPQALPDGDILFRFWGRTFYTAVFSPGTGRWRAATLDGKNMSGVYAESGYLLVVDPAAHLRAAAWTPKTSAPVRPETVVLDNVNWTPGAEYPWFAVSATGTAAFLPGNPSTRQLVWVDRQGKVTPISGESGQIDQVVLSPDGHRVLHSGYDSQWVRDLVTGTRTRIVSDQLTYTAGWLPGAEDRIVLNSNKSGDWDLYTIRGTGGELTPLLTRPGTQYPLAVAPNGSIVFGEVGKTTGNDLWVLKPDGQTSPLVVSPFSETSASISHDGRYLAYVSNESGRSDIYALPMSGKGARVVVSVDGGTSPVWSHNGRELFYRADNKLISVQIRSMTPLALGERRTLLDVSAFESLPSHGFDVSADDQEFLFIRSDPGTRPNRIDVIVNWFPELLRLVPK